MRRQPLRLTGELPLAPTTNRDMGASFYLPRPDGGTEGGHIRPDGGTEGGIRGPRGSNGRAMGHKSKALALRRTSSAVVAQLHTLTRIAGSPRHSVPLQ